MTTLFVSETTQVEIFPEREELLKKETISEEQRFQQDTARGFWIWAGCALTLVAWHLVQDLPRLFRFLTG
ncbi:MAG: hypothetical protein EXR99_08040 [Gemmataceae bacterium]|nr:hypothetical protein [Gemmataceae bacterium]